MWAAATVAEVNPLHLLFGALLLHRALVWAERRSVRDLALGGLLVGLALGNHLLTLFIAPFVAVFVLWAGREILARPWILVPALAAVLVGLAVYLYIPLAASGAPPLPYNHPTLDSVLWLVSGTQFRGQFDFLSPKGPGEFIAALPTLWSLVGLASHRDPAGAGVDRPRRPRSGRPAFGLLCLAFLVTGIYIWANYLQLEHYLLVPWLVLGIGAAVALEGSPSAATGRARGLDGRWRCAGSCRGGSGSRAGRRSSLGAQLGRRRTEAKTTPARTMWTRCSPPFRRTRRSCRTGTPRRRCGTASSSRGSAGRPDRGRHEHRVRGLGHAREADRVAHLRAAGVHPERQRQRPGTPLARPARSSRS